MTDEIDTTVPPSTEYPEPDKDEVNPPPDMDPDVKTGVPEEPEEAPE